MRRSLTLHSFQPMSMFTKSNKVSLTNHTGMSRHDRVR